jgi:hypothetical protein
VTFSINKSVELAEVLKKKRKESRYTFALIEIVESNVTLKKPHKFTENLLVDYKSFLGSGFSFGVFVDFGSKMN